MSATLFSLSIYFLVSHVIFGACARGRKYSRSCLNMRNLSYCGCGDLWFTALVCKDDRQSTLNRARSLRALARRKRCGSNGETVGQFAAQWQNDSGKPFLSSMLYQRRKLTYILMFEVMAVGLALSWAMSLALERQPTSSMKLPILEQVSK